MLNTEQVLRKAFGADEAYIARFKLIAEKADITLDDFLLGKVYSTKGVEYTPEQRDQIVAELKYFVNQQFTATPVEKPTYTASAGAPGTGKTFALEQMFDIDVGSGQFAANAIYIGPDSVVLSQMRAHSDDCKTLGLEGAYTKWRDASNYIANFMFVKAITDNLNIVHDTTATSPKMKTILETLGKLSYTRSIHFFIADRAAREQTLLQRANRGRLFVTVEDSVNKAVDAYKRLSEHFYTGMVDSWVLYSQRGQYWLGNGDTIAFAVYDARQKPNIQILADGQKEVEHILKQMDANEKLKPELQTAVHEAVDAWIKAPDASYRSASACKM